MTEEQKLDNLVVKNITTEEDYDYPCEYLGCWSGTKNRYEVTLYDNDDNEVDSSVACGDCLDSAKDYSLSIAPIEAG